MKAIIFDLGGVILDSPLSEIARYESEAEIPPGGINAVIGATGANGAWAKHEQGKLTTNEFVVDFGAECGAAGFDIDVRELLGRIARATAIRGVWNRRQQIQVASMLSTALLNRDSLNSWRQWFSYGKTPFSQFPGMRN